MLLDKELISEAVVAQEPEPLAHAPPKTLELIAESA